MRIDIVQPQPIAEVPKVDGGNSASTNYKDELNRKLGKYVPESGKQGENESNGSSQEQVDKLNEKMEKSGRKIQFKVMKNPNQIIAQIVDTGTGEVIEEIPSEKLMEILGSIGETSGQNIDKKV